MGLTDYGHRPSNEWRLKTPGGIPYKWIGMDGSFEYSTGNITMTILIESHQLDNLMREIFPPPVTTGNLTLPGSFTLEGAPNFIAKNASFRSQDTNIPIDPFGADSGANPKTYFPVIEVDIEFAPMERKPPEETDPEDPTTFLEITATGGGEFIHGGAEGVKFDGEENKNPNIPLIIVVPTTEWTVRWPLVDYTFFKDIFYARMLARLGTVNSDNVKWVYNTPPETLLFESYSLKQNFDWRSGQAVSSPIDLELKFTQKYVIWKGGVIGHNHTWKPGEGWKKVTIGDDNTNPYGKRTFQDLFDV